MFKQVSVVVSLGFGNGEEKTSALVSPKELLDKNEIEVKWDMKQKLVLNLHEPVRGNNNLAASEGTSPAC